MDKEKGNGNTVLLTVIGVATLLVALVGATFAYFSATITSTAKESIYITTATPVGLKYEGKNLQLENIIPGQSESNTFTVTNPNPGAGETGVVQTYDLHLVIDENGLVSTTNPGQLIVTVTSESTTQGHTKADTATMANSTMNALATGATTGWGSGAAGVYDLTDGTTAAAAKTDKLLSDNQEILIGEVHTYTVKTEFVELDKDQNENQTKTFKAHFEVTDPVSVNK